MSIRQRTLASSPTGSDSLAARKRNRRRWENGECLATEQGKKRWRSVLNGKRLHQSTHFFGNLIILIRLNMPSRSSAQQHGTFWDNFKVSSESDQQKTEQRGRTDLSFYAWSMKHKFKVWKSIHAPSLSVLFTHLSFSSFPSTSFVIIRSSLFTLQRMKSARFFAASIQSHCGPLIVFISISTFIENVKA